MYNILCCDYAYRGKFKLIEGYFNVLITVNSCFLHMFICCLLFLVKTSVGHSFSNFNFDFPVNFGVHFARIFLGEIIQNITVTKKSLPLF